MSKVVCVTGASGAIGSWLVRLLLERGYTVHSTVQDLKNEDETKHLEAMEGAKSRLCLFQMDLLDYDSIAAAIKGCAGVFHLACPIIIGQVKDPEKETLEPAIKGTVNVLKAAKEAGVERVVVTSSTSAIIPSPNWPADKIKGEDCWTDLDYCREKGARVVPNLRIRMWYMPKLELQAMLLPQARVVPGLPGKDESMNHFTITNTSHVYLLHKLQLYYPIAKTLAEKAGWDFAKETGFDVVMINPGSALGPLIPPRINASMAALVSVLKGDTETYKDFFMGMAHFKDIATAHILAFEKKKAAGRHLCVEAIRHYGDYVAKVAELYPEYNVAKLPKDTQPGLLRAKDVSKKLIDLGLEFTPIDQIIKDAVESLKSKGYV